MADITGTYMPFHNLFIDAKLGFRKTISEMEMFVSETMYFTLGIRLNIVQRNYDF